MRSAPRIHTHPDATAFLNRAGAWLLAREAEHSLVLGVAARLQAGNHGYEDPIFLATVENEGEIVGCAYRTPPYLLVLTGMPLEAVEPLVDAVAGYYAALPNLLGPEPEATRFAQLWSRMRKVEYAFGMRERIHALDRVEELPPADGAARPASPGELPLAMAWADAFAVALGLGPEIRGRVEGLVRDGKLWLWDHGGPKAMAAEVAGTPNGARVGLVYTPPAHRSRGYATRVTAALSSRLLAEGRRQCYLVTDLADPIANGIYARIGYRPVRDLVEIRFGGARSS